MRGGFVPAAPGPQHARTLPLIFLKLSWKMTPCLAVFSPAPPRLPPQSVAFHFSLRAAKDKQPICVTAKIYTHEPGECRDLLHPICGLRFIKEQRCGRPGERGGDLSARMAARGCANETRAAVADILLINSR